VRLTVHRSGPDSKSCDCTNPPDQLLILLDTACHCRVSATQRVKNFLILRGPASGNLCLIGQENTLEDSSTSSTRCDCTRAPGRQPLCLRRCRVPGLFLFKDQQCGCSALTLSVIVPRSKTPQRNRAKTGRNSCLNFQDAKIASHRPRSGERQHRRPSDARW
jgi:hypothetical protein